MATGTGINKIDVDALASQAALLFLDTLRHELSRSHCRVLTEVETNLMGAKAWMILEV